MIVNAVNNTTVILLYLNESVIERILHMTLKIVQEKHQSESVYFRKR